jgi:hypothetical protein
VFRPSCGACVLVDQAVEDRFSTDVLCVDVSHGGADTVAFVVGNVLRDTLVRPGGVVVRLVFGHLVALVRAGATFVNGKLAERPGEDAAPEAA